MSPEEIWTVKHQEIPYTYTKRKEAKDIFAKSVLIFYKIQVCIRTQVNPIHIYMYYIKHCYFTF